MLGPTHFFFALAIAYILRFPPMVTAISGVLPDIDVALDYGYPLIHRGIVHTPLFVAVASLALFAITRKKEYTYGFAAGFLSHLFIDTANPSGILWLYPLGSYFSFGLSTYSNIIANVGIIVVSLAFIVMFHPTLLKTVGIRKGSTSYSDNVRFIFFGLLIAASLGVSALGGALSGYASPESGSYATFGSYANYTTSEVLNILPLDEYVNVYGEVSEILSDYTSQKGYVYQRFYVTDGRQELMVFCSKYKGSIDVSVGDNVSVNGKFQKYGSTYEIYAECSGVKITGN